MGNLLFQIEKFLQRIYQGIKNFMYIICQFIENKVGGILGWKDLFQVVGFRFEVVRNGLLLVVFFFQIDFGDRFIQVSVSLQVLLGVYRV